MLTKVSNESGIGLYKITFSTGEEKIQEAINSIEIIFENLEENIRKSI